MKRIFLFFIVLTMVFGIAYNATAEQSSADPGSRIKELPNEALSSLDRTDSEANENDVTDLCESDIAQINFEDAGVYEGKFYILNTIPNDIVMKDEIENFARNVPVVNLFDKSTASKNTMLNNQYVQSENGMVVTDFIPVEVYTTISTNFIPNMVGFYDADKAYITKSQAEFYFFSIPDGTTYVRFSFASNENATYFKAKNESLTMAELMDYILITVGSGARVAEKIPHRPDSLFRNEIWDSLGDSLTQAKGYQKYVSAYYGLKGYHDNGIGGTPVGGTSANAFWQDVRINALCPVADCITIAGGTNDYGLTIGEVSWDNFDVSTFVGAYNTLLYKIYYRYGMLITDRMIDSVDVSGTEQVDSKNVRLFLIAPPYNDNNKDLTQYAEAVEAIAKMWGIPCVRSIFEMGINKFNADLYFPANDRTHFMENAHQKWAECMIGVYNAHMKIAN